MCPTYEFPRPAVSTDVVLLSGTFESRVVLLVRRGQEPFLDMWALPGGFVDEGERLEDAARRELAEETGVEFDGRLVQVGAFGDPGRDPRGWTVSIVFVGEVGGDAGAQSDRGAQGDTGAQGDGGSQGIADIQATEESTPEVVGGDDAAEAAWHPLDALPPLAFDHAEIIAVAVSRAGSSGRACF